MTNIEFKAISELLKHAKFPIASSSFTVSRMASSAFFHCTIKSTNKTKFAQHNKYVTPFTLIKQTHPSFGLSWTTLSRSHRQTSESSTFFYKTKQHILFLLQQKEHYRVRLDTIKNYTKHKKFLLVKIE